MISICIMIVINDKLNSVIHASDEAYRHTYHFDRIIRYLKSHWKICESMNVVTTEICKSHQNRFSRRYISDDILNMPSRWEKERRIPNGNAVTKHRFCQFYCWLTPYADVRSTGLGILQNSKKKICAKKSDTGDASYHQSWSWKTALMRLIHLHLVSSSHYESCGNLPHPLLIVSQWETGHYFMLISAVTRKKKKSSRAVWQRAPNCLRIRENMWL